jgi:hypothetical protein
MRTSSFRAALAVFGWMLYPFVHRLYFSTSALMFGSFDSVRLSVPIGACCGAGLAGEDYEAVQLFGMCYHVRD